MVMPRGPQWSITECEGGASRTSSATDRRRQPRCSIALLTISDGEPSAEIIALPLSGR